MSSTSVEPLEARRLLTYVYWIADPTERQTVLLPAGHRFAADAPTTSLYKLVPNTANLRVVVADRRVQYPTMHTQRIGLTNGRPVSYGPDEGHITLKDGTLTVNGTARDDTVEVYSTGTRIEAYVRSSNGKHAVEYVNNYAVSDVLHVDVNGGGGSDVLRVNAGTQRITSDTAVKVRYSEQADGTALPSSPSLPEPGVLHGSTHDWVKASSEQIASAAKHKAAVALVGDSMLDYFDQTGSAVYTATFGRRAVDLGLAGDTTGQVLYRIQHQGLLDGMSPKVVVLEVGTNNTVQTPDPAAVARGVATVVQAIHAKLPHTKVLINGVLPQHNGYDAEIARINTLLSILDNGNTVRFLATADTFASADAYARYYRHGQIHLNANGYAAWSRLIQPLLAEMMQ